VKRLVLVLLTLGLAAQATPGPQPFRIATQGGDGACRTVQDNAPAGQRAYADHLARRLGRPVLVCPFADRGAAAQALARGNVDLAVLDVKNYEAANHKVRAFATLRPKNGLSRVPVVISARAARGRDLAGFKDAPIAFGGKYPAAYELPKRTLAELGAGPEFFGAEIITVDHEAAAEALRAGRAEIMVLHASAQRRLCRPSSPGEKPCADLAEIWRGRPRADLALGVRKDMPDVDRYRLLGVHLALHLENPVAFGWAAAWAPGATEFEPAEADALAVKR
jgi:ABC-type phosphate/phosphonate transport system substrate-binding protein